MSKSSKDRVNTKRTLPDVSSQLAKISEFRIGTILETLGMFLERQRGGFGLQTCQKDNLKNRKNVFTRIKCIHENQGRNNDRIAQLYLQTRRTSKSFNEYACLSLL
jgi:hypothetical protein